MADQAYVLLTAGTTDVWTEDAAQQQSLERTLTAISEEGNRLLQGGARALDVVQLVVKRLEDCPHFNAAKGATFNEEGHHEVSVLLLSPIPVHHWSVT